MNTPEPGDKPCDHVYIEAKNYGDEKGNVECGKCGAFWIRFHESHLESIVKAFVILAAFHRPTKPQPTSIPEGWPWCGHPEVDPACKGLTCLGTMH